jgi:hypothetical protein
MGQSRPGRADSGYSYVGCPLIPTGSCVAAEFRDVPRSDIGNFEIDRPLRRPVFPLT